jgi:hypothetical protein
LCGHPKSGTSLLLSLLDGHPELVALPEETKYFRAIHGRDDLRTAEALLARTRIGRLGRARAEALAQGRDYGHVDAARFERELAERLVGNREPAELLPAAALAWAAASGAGPGRYWVEKTPLHEHALDTALDLWPDLLAIYVVRDPRDVHASFLAKRSERGRGLSVLTSALRIRRSLAAWRRFADRHAQHCWTVGYEDLVREPERVTREIASFLGIEWRSELLQPSLAGRSWTGNSMFGEQHDGISAKPVGRYRTSLSRAQIRALELALWSDFHRYGWPR